MEYHCPKQQLVQSLLNLMTVQWLLNSPFTLANITLINCTSGWCTLLPIKLLINLLPFSFHRSTTLDPSAVYGTSLDCRNGPQMPEFGSTPWHPRAFQSLSPHSMLRPIPALKPLFSVTPIIFDITLNTSVNDKSVAQQCTVYFLPTRVKLIFVWP